MADDFNSLFRLTGKHVKSAAEVLGRAFQDYPLSSYFMPEETQRRKKQPVLFRSMVRHSIMHGEVYATSPQLEGVAVWFSSESKRESFWNSLMSGRFLI